MKGTLGLALLLSAFWLISSGYLYPLLLTLGAASVALVVLLMSRVDSIDGARYPVIIPAWRLPSYLVWLTWEIIKSNLAVARSIWAARPAISPTIVHVSASQQTDAARALHANSITMTPGTVTLDVQGDLLEVHALTKSGADELLNGPMDRNVRGLEPN